MAGCTARRMAHIVGENDSWNAGLRQTKWQPVLAQARSAADATVLPVQAVPVLVGTPASAAAANESGLPLRVSLARSELRRATRVTRRRRTVTENATLTGSLRLARRVGEAHLGCSLLRSVRIKFLTARGTGTLRLRLFNRPLAHTGTQAGTQTRTRKHWHVQLHPTMPALALNGSFKLS